jgi:hypothetical protein
MRRLRFSLLGLFGLTALAALACTSLLSASAPWIRVLLTASLLLLLTAVVIAVCRRGLARAFGVGAAIFGWGYLLLQQPGIPAGWSSPFTGSAWVAPGTHTPLSDYLGTTWLLEVAYDKALPLVRTPPGAGVAVPVTFFLGGMGLGGGSMVPNPGMPPGVGGQPGAVQAPGVGHSPGMAGGGPGAGYDLFGGYFDPNTGAFVYGPPGGGQATAPPFYPTREDFIAVGQALWTIVFALVGGLLGRCLWQERGAA